MQFCPLLTRNAFIVDIASVLLFSLASSIMTSNNSTAELSLSLTQLSVDHENRKKRGGRKEGNGRRKEKRGRREIWRKKQERGEG